MDSKKCPGPTNLNQNSGFWAKFESNLWDSGTFLTPCVRGLNAVFCRVNSIGRKSWIISSAAVGVFFLAGVIIIAIKRLIWASLCFFPIVSIESAPSHSSAPYVNLGLIMTVLIDLDRWGFGPHYLLSAATIMHRYSPSRIQFRW